MHRACATVFAFLPAFMPGFMRVGRLSIAAQWKPQVLLALMAWPTKWRLANRHA